MLVFENKGEVVGVSNPHPHCQIYATNFVFKTIETEARAGERHLAETGRVLFQDILAAEHADGRRIIAENDSAIAFVPYFARYAYEVFVAPKATHPSLAALTDGERRDLAAVLQRRARALRQPLADAVPVRDAPAPGADRRPRLSAASTFTSSFIRRCASPTCSSTWPGPEIGGGNFLSDTSPEEKAAELRALPAVHYRRAR